MEAAASIYTRIIFPDEAARAEARPSDMQKAMLDVTPDCIKVVTLDGRLRMMNRAGCKALGVPEDSDFGMPWLPLLPDEVHPAGTEALRKAVAGQPARFPGKSTSPEGTIYWDNLLTPLVDASGQVQSILCVSRDVTEKTLLERRLEEAVDREKLVAREMRHRIKNVFSIVSGLISISKREAMSGGDTDTAMEALREKIGALARASDAFLAQENGGVADVIETGAVVASVLQPYGDRCLTDGGEAPIRREAVTTLALLLHELATNSVKYGALAGNDGIVTVRWTASEGSLDLAWIEAGGPAIQGPPSGWGFGTEMVDRVLRSAGGTIHRDWRHEGLTANLRFPDFVEDPR